MSLWVDKHRPATLDQLTYHNDLSLRLKRLATSDNFPHLLFYGAPGSGRKTRLAALLREIYGPSVEKLKTDVRQFVTTSGRKISFTVLSSNFHLELNLSDLGMHDRVIVQDVIKSIAQTQQIDANAKHRFKVVVINQADELTREAQAALRRTMEKYTSSMRLILCCNSLSKIIAPVRSRCQLIRVPRPPVECVDKVLQKVANAEGIELPSALSTGIAEQSQCNLRAALLSMETTVVQHAEITEVQRADRHDWEIEIAKIAKLIIEEQTPARIMKIREHLYKLLERCIQGSLIIKNLAFEMASLVDNDLRPVILDSAAFHEHRLRMGKKDIFHLEAFVASVMHAYKSYMMRNRAH